jgi:ATP-dependent DNA ligase
LLGEIVYDKKENVLKFVVFDVLVLKDKNISKETQEERFLLLKENSQEIKKINFYNDEEIRFEIYLEEPKSFEDLDGLNEMIEKKTYPFESDGIIVSKKDSIYPFVSTNVTIYKWFLKIIIIFFYYLFSFYFIFLGNLLLCLH